MRQVVLDTETTGLRHEDGHRVIEIGCVELVDRRLTGESLHFYIHPERDIDEGAIRIHGITLEDLADKPKFAEVAERIEAFCQGAELLIHNASFDMGFLDAEFLRVSRKSKAFTANAGKVTDTLALAKSLFPGKRNSLDALCERTGINNAHRTRHGALLDAELLAEVYLAMTRGQDGLDMGSSLEIGKPGHASESSNDWPPKGLSVVGVQEAALQAHELCLQAIDKASKGATLWRRAS